MRATTDSASGPRRGTTLLELLVGLTIAALLGLALVTLLRRQVGATSAAALNTRAAREMSLALAPLALELRSASAVPAPLLSPTDAEFSTLVLDGAGCVLPDRRVLLRARSHATRGGASWRAEPDTRDLALLLRPRAPADLEDSWSTHAIADVVVSTAAHASCPAADAPASTAVVLTLDPLPSEFPGDSITVQVVRRVRWAVTLGGDGAWWLSQRRCAPLGGACDASQPVAGPLRAAADGGIHLAYEDSTGAAVPAPTGWAELSLVRVTLRSASGTERGMAAVRREHP